MKDLVPALLAVLLFPPLFIGMWVGIISLLARVGGWSRLAREYPVPGEVRGESLYWRSARMGVVNYSGCLNLTANETGMLLAVSRLFSVGHAAFFVPWGEIEAEQGRRLFFRVVRLRFRRVPGARLEVSEALARQLRQASGERLNWSQAAR